MKILEIELKNLNSLRGQWRINLSEKIYENNGIFAITGPTGAGKTTIFDAVCLALYGQTPRLSNINDNTNEIMSRRTDECYAKVLFEAFNKKYICLWSQRKSSKNKLQKQKHILSDAETGEIFSNSIKETHKKIEEITGLDFKRFRQAVMLEQGGFDAFLKAKKNERAEILELLTGTEIYSEISSLVYKRTDEEKQKLETIKIQREGINLNDGIKSEDEINSEIEANKKTLSLMELEQNEIKKAVEWLKNIQKLQREILENQHEINQHNKRAELFTSENKKLEAGLKAAELLQEYTILQAGRDNAKKLSERIRNIKNNIEHEDEKISQIESQELPEFENRLKELIKNLPESESPEVFSMRAKERVNYFNEIATKKQKIENEKAKTEKKLKQAQIALKSAEENLTLCRRRYDNAAKKFDDLVNMRTEAILENERRKLQPGSPCPLCGALEHPLITHSEGVNSDDALKFDDTLKMSRTQRDTAKNDFENASKNLTLLKANESMLNADFNNLLKDFDTIAEQRSQAREEIANLLQYMGILVKNISEINPGIDAWLKNIKTLKEKIKSKNENRDFLKAKVEADKKNLSMEISEFEFLTGELEKLEKGFISKLHEKNFESEESFNAACVDSEKLKNLRAKKEELESENNKLKGVQEDLAKKLENEKAKNRTSKNLEDLEPEYKELEKLINELKRKNILLEKNLEDLIKKQAQIEELNKQYKEQSEIYSNWSALNNLIGSAKGDRFRVFAQNITLEMIINLANMQLEKMNGRYILITRPGSDELDLSVIDKEQAGEIRPTENLSGGEKFIISLALALGLSQISGNKSRIDSLFLDEGFGSLDENSLNMALDALGEVRRGGRMIGIISHVQALRERIAAQINVIPKHEGVSIIEGPGVL